MVQTASNWERVLAEVRSTFPQLSLYSHKFKQITILKANEYELSPEQFKELAIHLGLNLYQKPTNVPNDWKMVICHKYLSQKYRNPYDSYEYLVVVPNNPKGKLPSIIHRTAQGYADPQWFYELIPELEKIDKSLMDYPFSEEFNSKIEGLYQNGLSPGQVQALNLFFEKYVPGVEGICSTCYKVSLPRSGAGERWMYRKDMRYEIRLSAAKRGSKHPGQQVEYVSHTEVDREGKLIFATWDKKRCLAGFDTNMVQENTHIPWDVYDFKKFSLGMPLCHCLKK